ncbi:hypothetical protein ACFX12_009614 [Malus domestica]
MTSPCMLFIILLGLGLGTSAAATSSQSAPANIYDELERSLREIERANLNSQEKELRLAILKARFEDSMSIKNESFNKRQGKDNSCADSKQNKNFNKQGDDNSSSSAMITLLGQLNGAAGCLKIPHRHTQVGALGLLAVLALSIMFVPFCIVCLRERQLKHKRREICDLCL